MTLRQRSARAQRFAGLRIAAAAAIPAARPATWPEICAATGNARPSARRIGKERPMDGRAWALILAVSALALGVVARLRAPRNGFEGRAGPHRAPSC